MQLQGRSCRKQSSHPGACTWPPSPLQSSRLLPNSFPCRMFHLDQGQQIISRTEEHPKVWAEKGNEEILSTWNGDPLGVPESAFKKTWRQNFLVKALLAIPVVSQFISFKAWNQNISHFFAGCCLALLCLLFFLAACVSRKKCWSLWASCCLL